MWSSACAPARAAHRGVAEHFPPFGRRQLRVHVNIFVIYYKYQHVRQILAEGEEPETNILRVLLRNRANYCEADRGRNCGGLSVYALSFSCVVVAGLPDRNQQLVDIGAMDVDEQRARGACKILSLEARSSEADRVN